MHGINSRGDELAMMNAPIDVQDLTIKILNGLDESYMELANAIYVRDTLIT